jgi:hypothetical protein
MAKRLARDFARLARLYENPTEAAQQLGVTAPDENIPRLSSEARNLGKVLNSMPKSKQRSLIRLMREEHKRKLLDAGVDPRLVQSLGRKQRKSGSW